MITESQIKATAAAMGLSPNQALRNPETLKTVRDYLRAGQKPAEAERVAELRIRARAVTDSANAEWLDGATFGELLCYLELA